MIESGHHSPQNGPEEEVLVDCPRCQGGYKYGYGLIRQPYDEARLAFCAGSCFLCCDMHKIPIELWSAYELVRGGKPGVEIGTLERLKRDFFGEGAESALCVLVEK